MIKPGSVIIILLAAAIGFVIFDWASVMLDTTGNQSTEQREDSIQCSTLKLRFKSGELNETHYYASVQPDQALEAVAITFEGDRNVTRIITDAPAGSIEEVRVKMEGVSGTRANVKGCSRVFR